MNRWPRRFFRLPCAQQGRGRSRCGAISVSLAPCRPVARLAISCIFLSMFSFPVNAQENTPSSPTATDEGRTQGPQRIVSLNLCADELLLHLVPKERIASLTTLAQDPASSNVVELAQGIPANRGLAEEIIPLAPDLVISGAFTTRNTVSTLRRFGIEVLDLGVPKSLDEAYAQIRDVAHRLGVPEKGEEMIATLQAAIPPQSPLNPHAPRTIVVRPNGFTAGRDTLADDLMRRAGLDNVAARLSPDRLGQLPLEEIVNARPQVLILDTDPKAPPSMAGAIMQHPVLAHAAIEAQMISLPSRMWACVGPQLAEAYQRLAAGAEAARAAAMQKGRTP